jgi:type IV secretory pathway VirB10-like protein
MRQRPENFNPAGEDPDETLIAPRFDADDARRAHPVVPLVEAPRPEPRARRRRRSWTPALLAVALFAAAALGGAVATKFTQSPRAEQAQEQTQAAPVQTTEAPPPAQPSTPAAAEAPREDVTAARPSTPEPRPRRPRATAVAAEPPREVADDDEGGERRRKSAGKRRERDDDEVEKETRKQMEKAAKHSKGNKAPRLVDVLTPP